MSLNSKKHLLHSSDIKAKQTFGKYIYIFFSKPNPEEEIFNLKSLMTLNKYGSYSDTNVPKIRDQESLQMYKKLRKGYQSGNFCSERREKCKDT